MKSRRFSASRQRPSPAVLPHLKCCVWCLVEKSEMPQRWTITNSGPLCPSGHLFRPAPFCLLSYDTLYFTSWFPSGCRLLFIWPLSFSPTCQWAGGTKTWCPSPEKLANWSTCLSVALGFEAV